MDNDNYKDAIRRVVAMNVGWQSSYATLQESYDSLSKEMSRASAEIERLKDQLNESTKREEALSEKVNSLLEESATREINQTTKTKELLEQIEVLKAQSCIFAADFETERMERTELASKMAEMETELLNMKEGRLGASAPHRVRRRLFDETPPHQYVGVYQTDYHIDIPLDIPTDIPLDIPLDETDTHVDQHVGVYQTDTHMDQQLLDTPISGISMLETPLITTPVNDRLYCPRCNKPFSIDDHIDLVDHMDDCLF